MKLALLNEHHDGDADDRLGHGGDTEHRARCHGLFCLQVHHALRGVVNDLAFARHNRDGTRDVAGGDAPLDHLVDAMQAFRRQSHFFRLRGG